MEYSYDLILLEKDPVTQGATRGDQLLVDGKKCVVIKTENGFVFLHYLESGGSTGAVAS